MSAHVRVGLGARERAPGEHVFHRVGRRGSRFEPEVTERSVPDVG